ncbi:MAG: hypothetical protein HF973_15440 [Chloroflexi bacterium]|nr:hypothetical protein [Chloroflexota bacterium]
MAKLVRAMAAAKRSGRKTGYASAGQPERDRVAAGAGRLPSHGLRPTAVYQGSRRR